MRPCARKLDQSTIEDGEVHTLPQNTIPPYDQDTARRFGEWDCGPGDQRILRAIVLADRAHILTDLAIKLAPQVDLAHVITTIVIHVIAHPDDLFQYAHLTRAALERSDFTVRRVPVIFAWK